MRPDNYQHPERRHDPKSLFCCGEADIVNTKFKVENTGGPYPEDQWYAWLHDTWTLIPPEKILHEHAPNGEAFSLCACWYDPMLRAAEGRPLKLATGTKLTTPVSPSRRGRCGIDPASPATFEPVIEAPNGRRHTDAEKGYSALALNAQIPGGTPMPFGVPSTQFPKEERHDIRETFADSF